MEICRKHGISQQTFYLWKRKYAGLGLSELRELRQLREENAKKTRCCREHLLARERQPERLLETALERFRELRLESPTVERLERLLGSALRIFEEQFSD